jgi:DNA-binding GntR family transcriptional regulator
MHRIRAKTLHQEVTDQIRKMIRSGALIKGQKIDEKYLCDTMGVSRTPVRESLRMINSDRLIEIIPHKGAYVSQPPIKEIKDMFEVMSVLEGTCARLAAENMKEKDFRRIEALHGKLERHYQNRDHEAYLKVNNTLHVFVQELSGNKVLNDVINGLRQKILLYRHKQLYQPERFQESVREHRDLLTAFRDRDPVLAETVMKRHLIKQCEALVRLYAKNRQEVMGQGAK